MAALVVFCFEGRNPSGSPSSLSIPVPRELLSAFIWRNIEPMFCSPLLSGVSRSPEDIRTEIDQRSRTEVHLDSALNLFYFRKTMLMLLLLCFLVYVCLYRACGMMS